MSDISCLYVRLPNWVGDVCMSLPSLRALHASGLPLVICARPWARDLLDGVAKQDFIPMRGKVGPDRAAVSAHRRSLGALGRRARGLLLPDSLSSALVFRLAGLPSAGYRDDGRSFLLRWPVSKPDDSLHAVQSWHYLTRQALTRWGLPSGPAEPGPTLDLPLTAAHQGAAEQALEAAGLASGRFVLIAPTATGLHKGKIKVWPGFDTPYPRPPGRRAIPWYRAPSGRNRGGLAQCADCAAAASSVAGRLRGADGQGGAGYLQRFRRVSRRRGGSRQELTLFGVTRPGRTGSWSPWAVCVGSRTPGQRSRKSPSRPAILLDETQ